MGSFWSLTMYNPQNFLYPNQIDRYEVGNRTTGLVYNRNGSLTFYIQHNEPATAAERANWLPTPTAGFHLILRLYQPKPSVFDGSWKIAPVIADGETVVPVLSKLRISPRAFRPSNGGGIIGRHGPARVSYDDNQATVTNWKLYRRVVGRRHRYRLRVLATFRHRDRTGKDGFRLTGRVHKRALNAGRYVLKATATGSDDISPSRQVSVAFRVQ